MQGDIPTRFNRSGEKLADHDDSSPLSDLISAGMLAPCQRLLFDNEPALAASPVFVTLRGAPIPAIEPTPGEHVDVLGFALAQEVHGHLAWTTQRASSRGGAMLVLATCISLVLPDVALAQAPAGRQPTASATVPPPPALPPEPSTAVDPALVAAEVPPPQPVGADPAGDLQANLYALKGHEAVVYARGVKITGLLLNVDAQYVTMVDVEREGRIARIPRAQVSEVRGYVKEKKKLAPLDMSDGAGALAGGGIMVALGAPLTISGLVFVSLIPSSPVVFAPQLIPGLLLLGGGIPLIVLGSRRRRAYNSAMAERMFSGRMTPSFGRTPGGGWTGGLRLSF